METSYSADIDHIDDAVKLAAAERREGESIRVRLQPSLYRRSVGQHRDWAGVSWCIDCTGVEEAIALREALRVFFEALGRVGPNAVMVALTPRA